jgi:hypothetical protein
LFGFGQLTLGMREQVRAFAWKAKASALMRAASIPAASSWTTAE